MSWHPLKIKIHQGASGSSERNIDPSPRLGIAPAQMRMEERGFSQDDRLLKLVSKAFDAIHSLYNEMNYQACKSGAGREPKEE